MILPDQIHTIKSHTSGLSSRERKIRADHFIKEVYHLSDPADIEKAYAAANLTKEGLPNVNISKEGKSLERSADAGRPENISNII